MKRRILICAACVCAVLFGAFYWWLRQDPVTQPIAVNAEETAVTRAGNPAKGRVNSANAPKQKSDSKTLSTHAQQVLNSTLNFQERLAALRNLCADPAPTDLDALVRFLKGYDSADETPWGQTLKNELMNQLCQQDAPGIRKLLTEIYNDRSQNVVIRDYAVQHLIEHFQEVTQARESGERAVEAGEVARVLWDAVGETGESIAGTALMGLSRLSKAQPEFESSRVAETASRLVEDPAVGSFTRTAAIQVCAQMGVTNVLPALWQIAQSGETIPLRASAVVALGLLDQKEAVPWLKQLASGKDATMQPAAKRALGEIALLERQRIRAVQEELDRRRGEELRKEKQARQTATPK